MKNRNRVVRSFTLVLVVFVLLALVQAVPAQARGNDLTEGGTYVLRGGWNHDLYVRCDTGNWHCVGTRDRNSATRFVAIQASGKALINIGEPIPQWQGGSNSYGANITRNWQMQVKGSDLCMDVWNGTQDLNLYGCQPDVSVNQGLYMQENVANTAGGRMVNSTYIGSTHHGLLWWTGDGSQLVMVDLCGLFAWQCDNWHFERVD